MCIPAQVYRESESINVSTSLLIVSMDVAVGKNCFEKLSALSLSGSLARIFFDKAHVPFHYREFRSKLYNTVHQFSNIGVQLICLTGTAPPDLAGDIMAVYGLEPNSFVTVRAKSTTRDNLQYSVITCPSSHQLQTSIEQCVSQLRSVGAAKDLILIFCALLAQLNQLSALLGCPSYHARLDAAVKTSILDDFFNAAPGCTVLCTTSALTHGINSPNICHVIHAYTPYTLLKFAQESGRAGRDGNRASSIVFTVVPGAGDVDSPTTVDYIRSSCPCRRLVLQTHLDGSASRCKASQA